MKPTLQQHHDFLARYPLPGVLFEHNAYVHVVEGTHRGGAGNIISVEALGSDPLYLIELDSGKDVLLSKSSLRLSAA